MDDVTHTSRVRRGEDWAYDPYLQCPNKFELSSNNFRVCDVSNVLQDGKSNRNILVDGPPFETDLRWLLNQNDRWTVYDIVSSLSLEETKKIAASMCVE